jgi:glycosyltransferase involved in cell wall biosynthesis
VTTALVHDYLLAMRGTERTFAAIADVWPEAPIYTLLYDEQSTDGSFAGREIHSSMLQGQRVRQRGFDRLLPLFPWAIRRLPVQEHDLILSSSAGFALGVHPGREAVHVCYCHSPYRYAWHDRHGRPLVNGVIRRADRRALRNITDFVANSAITRERIAEFYERDATVIHPPVEVERFTPGEPEDTFLIVGELAPHKHIDVALEAVKRAGKRAKVVGSGPEYRRLFARYRDVAEFDRRLDDEELARLYASAQALIVGNVEEFGIAAVESQAAGRPVVGFDAGGLQETVVSGTTGVLVPPQDSAALAEALRETDFTAFDPNAIRDHAQQFSRERFQRELRRHVDRIFAREALASA